MPFLDPNWAWLHAAALAAYAHNAARWSWLRRHIDLAEKAEELKLLVYADAGPTDPGVLELIAEIAELFFEIKVGPDRRRLGEVRHDLLDARDAFERLRYVLVDELPDADWLRR